MSQVSTRDEKHDTRDSVPLHKEIFRENTLEFSYVDAIVRMLTKHERNCAERVEAIEAEYVEKVARIDARENER